jgi:DNA-binding MarR family transcriptional regulator
VSRNLPEAGRRALEERVLRGHEALLSRISSFHAPELLQIDISMAQLKALYLVAVQGPLKMSALADRLHVTLSTASGLADRLVEQGLLMRRHDPSDRRLVVVSTTPAGAGLLDRLRELSTRRLRSLLAGLAADDLRALARGIDSLARQAVTEASQGSEREPPVRGQPSRGEP